MREMLRIKRSVQAMYNTQVNMMSAQMLNNASNQISDVTSLDAMRLLDSKITASAGNRDFIHACACARAHTRILIPFRFFILQILNTLELQTMLLMSKELSNLYVV